MTTVTAKLQDSFFDRQKVLDQIGRDNARRLGRAGAFVRTRARSSLRRARSSKSRRRRTGSRAGQPPRVYAAGNVATLKNIQYGLRDDGESVVIGPLLLNQKNRFTVTSLTVPQLLEHGGTAGIHEYRWKNSDVWLAGRPRRKRDQSEVETRTRRARFAAHPFMGPALEKEIAAGKIADVWSK